MSRRFASLGFLACLTVAWAGPADGDGDGVADPADICPNTPAGIAVDSEGRPVGDHDLDCDVDLSDLEFFVANFTGPLLSEPREVCIDGVDNDDDSLVDCEDSTDCPIGSACAAGEVCSQFAICGCPGGTGDCDGDALNGCEVETDTDINHCGGCEQPCSISHALAACADGQCGISQCDPGWCDENLDVQDGCEFPLDSNPACTITPPDFTMPGDQNSVPRTVTARGEHWYRVRLTETNDFDVYLSVQFALESDDGTNYDLYVRCSNCGESALGSTWGPGVVDLVSIGNDDDWGSADDFDVIVEVRWVSGDCGGFTLTITGDIETNNRACD